MFGLKLAYFAIIAAPLTGIILVFIVPMLSGEEGDDHRDHFEMATQLHRQGLLPEAVYAYGQAISAKPDFPEAYAFRGEAWLTLGSQSQALRDFDQALGYEHQGFAKAMSDDLRIFKIAMAQSHHGRAVVYGIQGYQRKYQTEAAVAKESGYLPGLMEIAFGEIAASR